MIYAQDARQVYAEVYGKHHQTAKSKLYHIIIKLAALTSMIIASGCSVFIGG